MSQPFGLAAPSLYPFLTFFPLFSPDGRPTRKTPAHSPRLGPRRRQQALRLFDRRIRELETEYRPAAPEEGQPSKEFAEQPDGAQ